MHSHNVRRQKNERKRKFSAIHLLRLILLLFGVAAVTYYGYTLTDEYVYQAYQNWAFDQEIAGRTNVTFGDYVRAHIPFGLGATEPFGSNAAPGQQSNVALRPANGAILGRVAIPRLNLAAMVREGVDDNVLKVAVGHVPSTSLPGEPGNFAIAAHRDTLFRGLKDIQYGDLVTFQSPNGTYDYKVVATRIVRPSDVSVLRSDGGGLVPVSQSGNRVGQPKRLLTMITCYPFYYVGSAPKRFIVEAELVGDTKHSGKESSEVSERS